MQTMFCSIRTANNVSIPILTTSNNRQSSHSSVVVKLDIDTAKLELGLARQLEESPELLRLVDVLYFEHHVLLQELASSWGGSMSGSVFSSLDLFSRLRKSGVDTHFWV